MKAEKLNFHKIHPEPQPEDGYAHLTKANLKEMLGWTLPEINRLKDKLKDEGFLEDHEKSKLTNLNDKRLRITLELVKKEVDLLEKSPLDSKNQSRLDNLTQERNRIIAELSNQPKIKETKISGTKKFK